MTHPPKTKRMVCNACAFAVAATTARRTAHTAAHPTLYAGLI
jgi:hypothetical protein